MSAVLDLASMVRPVSPTDDVFVGPGGDRVSRSRAAEVLATFTPELRAERNLEEYYDANQEVRTPDGRHVDFAVVLEKFRHESSGGKAGMATLTKSWGNTRPPDLGREVGAGEVGRVPQVINGRPNGEFSKYATWLDGMKSTVARLVTPNYVYWGWGRRAIRDLYSWPDDPATPRDESEVVWAPAGDYNNPASYLRAIVDGVNRIMDQNRPTLAFQPPELIFDYIPTTNDNRPMTRIRPNRRVWHDTGNRSVGANAWAHRQFAHNGGGGEGVSYQLTVDDRRVYVLLPVGPDDQTEMAYHALAGCNRDGIAIEICVNADGDWARTLMNAAWLGGWIEDRVGRELGNEQHFGCTGKNCPAKIRERGEWDSFLRMLETFDNPPPVPAPPEEPLRFDGWPFQYVLGFKGHFLKVGGAVWPDNPVVGGLAVFGYPLENEWSDPTNGNSYQRAERYLFQWQPNVAPPWDIIGRFWEGSPPAPPSTDQLVRPRRPRKGSKQRTIEDIRLRRAAWLGRDPETGRVLESEVPA